MLTILGLEHAVDVVAEELLVWIDGDQIPRVEYLGVDLNGELYPSSWVPKKKKKKERSVVDPYA